MNTLLFCLLSAVFLAVVLLDKAWRTYPINELRRRARSGKDSASSRIYRLASFGHSVEISFWLIGGLAFAGAGVVAAQYSWWLPLILILAGSWLVWFGRPLNRYNSLMWSAASHLALPAVSLISFLHPALSRAASKIRSFSEIHTHSGIYEKEDLLDLIDKQRHQVDSRLSERELNAVTGALKFGDKPVGAITIPKREVRFVSGDEIVGPMLMDELHSTGLRRFPVVRREGDPSPSDVAGTLYLRDLLRNLEKGGTVRDIMKKDAAYINDTNNLREALDAFLKTQHHLLIVVNNFEEFVGVISLEDVLEQILGEKIADEFDRYEDLRAVAGKQATQEHSQHNETTIE